MRYVDMQSVTVYTLITLCPLHTPGSWGLIPMTVPPAAKEK